MKENKRQSPKKLKFHFPEQNLNEKIYGNQIYMQENLDGLSPNMANNIFDNFEASHQETFNENNRGHCMQNLSPSWKTQRDSGGWSKIFKIFISPPSVGILQEVLKGKEDKRRLTKVCKLYKKLNKSLNKRKIGYIQEQFDSSFTQNPNFPTISEDPQKHPVKIMEDLSLYNKQNMNNFVRSKYSRFKEDNYDEIQLWKGQTSQKVIGKARRSSCCCTYCGKEKYLNDVKWRIKELTYEPEKDSEEDPEDCNVSEFSSSTLDKKNAMTSTYKTRNIEPKRNSVIDWKHKLIKIKRCNRNPRRTIVTSHPNGSLRRYNQVSSSLNKGVAGYHETLKPYGLLDKILSSASVTTNTQTANEVSQTNSQREFDPYSRYDCDFIHNNKLVVPAVRRCKPYCSTKEIAKIYSTHDEYYVQPERNAQKTVPFKKRKKSRIKLMSPLLKRKRISRVRISQSRNRYKELKAIYSLNS
ncbi:unnamed protein product [Moneuplotes crassus]|uniref:Uncharacterized protein n=1 Tax=Euplotes crassus TaxID=5936 RepID=A0AAD1U7B9_EUPCR|nr:unnamed protein product [Moneuplotes crassus]